MIPIGCRFSIWCLIALCSTACRPAIPLTLEIPAYSLERTRSPAQADILVGAFSENLSSHDGVGELSLWSGSQKIMIPPGSAALGLTGRIGQLLADQGLSCARADLWDGRAGSLAQLPPAARAVLRGEITALRLSAHQQAVHTSYHLELTVHSQIGMVHTGTVVSRKAVITLDKSTALPRATALEQLLDQGITEAAQQIVAALPKK